MVESVLHCDPQTRAYLSTEVFLLRAVRRRAARGQGQRGAHRGEEHDVSPGLCGCHLLHEVSCPGGSDEDDGDDDEDEDEEEEEGRKQPTTSSSGQDDGTKCCLSSSAPLTFERKPPPRGSRNWDSGRVWCANKGAFTKRRKNADRDHTNPFPAAGSAI